MKKLGSLTCAFLALGLLACSEDEQDPGFPPVEPVDLGPDFNNSEPDLGSDAEADSDPDQSFACEHTEDAVPEAELYTPRWAFLPWISKDISDRDDSYEFVNGFLERDIPLGVLVLDSPWETSYNTFIPNPERYPDFNQMVADFREDGVRTVLWVTAQVNEASFDLESGGDTYVGPASNFEEGLACGYYINDGRTDFWWKGRGASVDFFNPGARAWWHAQQDAVLDAGVAGWKLDFGDEYVLGDTVETAEGVKPHQEYSEEYYRDFFNYGAAKLGTDEFVTMVRAYDQSYQHEGRFFARREHAPVVWVGDNHRDWVGLEDALDHTFRSAVAGYAVIGSDLGGYLDRDELSLGTVIPFDRVNFLRWLAVSALSPFMQLHGRGNTTPWTLPDDPNPEESVALYRYWSVFHTELIPFWYSLSRTAYATNGAENIIRPLGDENSWAGDYRYVLGDALLVAPILDETGIRDVEMPEGEFYDWWTEEPVAGGQTLSANFSADLGKIPLWVKRGAIIPVETDSDLTGFGAPELDGALTVLGWPATEATSFDLYEEDKSLTELSMDADSFEIARTLSTTYVRLRMDTAPTTVSASGEGLETFEEAASLSDLYAADSGWVMDGTYLWVKLPESGVASTISF